MSMSYEKALKKAKKLNGDVNYCVEYNDAYCFSDKNDMSFGGNGPVVILKDSGDAVNLSWYINEANGRIVKEFDIE